MYVVDTFMIALAVFGGVLVLIWGVLVLRWGIVAIRRGFRNKAVSGKPGVFLRILAIVGALICAGVFIDELTTGPTIHFLWPIASLVLVIYAIFGKK